MNKEIEIPEGYEAKIENNKVIFVPKESEDEKIRKELIGYLTHRAEVTGFIDEDKDCKRWIAYFEKQKEQKPESCDCSRDEESYTNGIHHVLMNPEAYGLIKQKPAEWSEEDKHCIHQLILFCENCMQQDSEAIRCATWLKSLRPQPHWKPSEEQMKALEDAFRKDGGNEYRKIINSLYNDLQKLL